MPKKPARTRTVKRKPPKTPEPMPFEKIDLLIAKEEEHIEKDVETIVVKVKRLLTDHSSLTKAEFVKFFILPFSLSFVLLFVFLLTITSKDPIRIPSFQVKTTVRGFGDILTKLTAITNKGKSLKGQEIFDPYQVKLDLDRGELFYALIDIRSPEEFSKGHIRDAVNLPAYSNFNDLKKLSLSEGGITQNLRRLVPRKKPIVVYGTTRDSQVTHDIVAILSRNGYEVSTLGVGWNEWRHFTNLWVPEAGWDSFQIENYVDEK